MTIYKSIRIINRAFRIKSKDDIIKTIDTELALKKLKRDNFVEIFNNSSDVQNSFLFSFSKRFAIVTRLLVICGCVYLLMLIYQGVI